MLLPRHSFQLAYSILAHILDLTYHQRACTLASCVHDRYNLNVFIYTTSKKKVILVFEETENELFYACMNNMFVCHYNIVNKYNNLYYCDCVYSLENT